VVNKTTHAWICKIEKKTRTHTHESYLWWAHGETLLSILTRTRPRAVLELRIADIIFQRYYS
jgi:hypothetical protein